MNSIIKTAVLSMALLTIVPTFAKREWNPACTCTFGLPAPTIKEVFHDHTVGQRFTVEMSRQCFGENADTFKQINESGIVACITDLDAIRKVEKGIVSVIFESLKPGKVLLFTETHIELSESGFANRIKIIDHYATIDMLHCCLTPSPKRNNIYPMPNSNADDITFRHWSDSNADDNTFRHSNNLEKMPRIVINNDK